MRKRESHVLSLSVLVVLLIVAPAFAVFPVHYTLFSNVYDFDPWGTTGLPTGEERDAWTVYDTSGVAWTNADSLTLNHENTGDNKYSFFALNPVASDPMSAATAWTFEVRAKVNSQGAQTGSGERAPAGLYVGMMNVVSGTKKSTELVIQSSAILLRAGTDWVTLDSSSNSGAYHTTRVVSYSDGQVQVYRDGGTTPLGTGLTRSTSTNSFASFVVFGDNASASLAEPYATDGLNTNIDYLAFDIGNAFVPEPTAIILLAVGSLACLLRKRH